MNIELLQAARERIPSVPVLVNVISKRVKQLNQHDAQGNRLFRPYVKPKHRDEEAVDLALREIVEGKLVAEVQFGEAGKG
jgi:DNA-directed RNA polymerase subunit K/omega